MKIHKHTRRNKHQPISVVATCVAEKYRENSWLRLHGKNGYAIKPQATRLRYAYVINLVVFKNSSFLHVQHDTRQQPTSRPNRPAPTVPVAAAGRPPPATPPQLLAFLRPQEILFREVIKKVFDDPGKICTGTGLYKWKESNGTFAVRNKSHVVIRTVHSSCVLSIGAVPDAMGQKMRWGTFRHQLQDPTFRAFLTNN